MSWFRSALSISVPDPGSYYSTIDPIDFYEWKFTNTAPKGTIFAKQLPPSDTFISGKVIVSAIVLDTHLKQLANSDYRLINDSSVELGLKIGNIPSPRELIDKYNRAIHNFDTGVDRFKENMLTRLFVHSYSDNPHLLGVANYTKDNVTFHNYGPVSDLIKRFADVRDSIMQESTQKIGRSYEMEAFRRYESNMTFNNNSHLHVDASKMRGLIEAANIKPENSQTSSWKDLYLQTSEGAQKQQDLIGYFESKKWFQSARSANCC